MALAKPNTTDLTWPCRAWFFFCSVTILLLVNQAEKRKNQGQVKPIKLILKKSFSHDSGECFTYACCCKRATSHTVFITTANSTWLLFPISVCRRLTSQREVEGDVRVAQMSVAALHDQLRTWWRSTARGWVFATQNAAFMSNRRPIYHRKRAKALLAETSALAAAAGRSVTQTFMSRAAFTCERKQLERSEFTFRCRSPTVDDQRWSGDMTVHV